MKGKRIWFCAGRGGVGVGFVCVNLALALCRAGRRVLLVDGNPFCRALDAVFSCEEEVVYDLSDLCGARVSLSEALLFPLGHDKLALLTGVFDGKDMPAPKRLMAALDRAAEEFDFVLLDMPPLPAYLSLAPAFDECLVVADPSAPALRGAEKTGFALRDAGCTSLRLVLNRFSLYHPQESGQKTALSMVDACKLQLIAILPPVGEYDHLHRRVPETFPLLDDRKCYRRDRARQAFDHFAARLGGAERPLLFGMRGLRKRRRYLLY